MMGKELPSRFFGVFGTVCNPFGNLDASLFKDGKFEINEKLT
jgi:hypothetical protein